MDQDTPNFISSPTTMCITPWTYTITTRLEVRKYTLDFQHARLVDAGLLIVKDGNKACSLSVFFLCTLTHPLPQLCTLSWSAARLGLHHAHLGQSGAQCKRREPTASRGYLAQLDIAEDRPLWRCSRSEVRFLNRSHLGQGVYPQNQLGKGVCRVQASRRTRSTSTGASTSARKDRECSGTGELEREANHVVFRRVVPVGYTRQERDRGTHGAGARS
mmetsp:Transcript_13890/g.25699  ORF Transcript_13890/g.25699 Transcript_13890/m.25699 type:complete len:217 (+) Transcript_13890:210-860(+)